MLLELAAFYAYAALFITGAEVPAPSRPPAVATRHLPVSGFGPARTIMETFPRKDNKDPTWWVSSGAYLIVERDGTARTLTGELSTRDPWRARYQASSPSSTQAGRFPQHLFRAVTNATTAPPVRAEVFVRALVDRSGGQGGAVCLMLGYQGEDNTYFGCLTTHGRAYVKRKERGAYLTLGEVATRPLVASTSTSLPWTGLALVWEPSAGRGAELSLLREEDGVWRTLLYTHDANPLRPEGQAGLRTDMVDVRFRDYTLRPLTPGATASSF